MCRPRCTSFATRAIRRSVIPSPTTGSNASRMMVASNRFHGWASHRQPARLSLGAARRRGRVVVPQRATPTSSSGPACAPGGLANLVV
jgi:hypothetical protein